MEGVYSNEVSVRCPSTVGQSSRHPVILGHVLVYVCPKTCIEAPLVCVGNPLLVGDLAFDAVWVWDHQSALNPCG